MCETKDAATYNYIKLTVTAKENEDAEKLSFYYLDSKLKTEINGSDVSVTLDSNFCDARQNESDKFIYLKKAIAVPFMERIKNLL